MEGLRRTALLWALGLSVPTVATGCRQDAPHVDPVVRVEAGPPKVRDVDVTLRYPIELEADETVAITPVAISGFLRKVLVDVGDKVKAGQLIALIDCREYTAQRTQAETVIAKWEAQVDESRSQLDRLTRMGEKLVAPAELDRAQAEARVAEAELADARAKLSEAGQRQGYCSLAAPFSGYVTERFLDPGAMVGPGSRPVVNIVKTRDVRVVASIVEQDATKVVRGASVDLVLHAFPETTFRAEVARVGRSLDPSTRTLRVEMDIPNTTELLLPGMTGRAAIVVGKRENALLVPVTAILKLEDVVYVYVVREEDGRPRAHRVEVALGVDFGDWIEVREGLSAEDQVIMVGRELVDNGTVVEVMEAITRPRAAPPTEAPTPEPGQVSIEDDTDTGTDGEPDRADVGALEPLAAAAAAAAVEEPTPRVASRRVKPKVEGSAPPNRARRVSPSEGKTQGTDTGEAAKPAAKRSDAPKVASDASPKKGDPTSGSATGGAQPAGEESTATRASGSTGSDGTAAEDRKDPPKTAADVGRAKDGASSGSTP